MQYTHYENIHGMCMIRADYFACFAGGAVMALLVDMALEDDDLRDWWNLGEYYRGV